jgi:gliding motility-associated-like protein
MSTKNKPICYFLSLLLLICFSGRSQIINTVAGNGVAGFSGDGGSATAASFNQTAHCVVDASGNIYITDYNNNRIRKVSTTGIVTTYAGTGIGGYSGDGGPATAAKINHPNGLDIDAAGNLFFADQYNNVIRKISSSGVISTFAGTGIFGYSGDGGPATAAKLGQATNVKLGSAGDLYITDYSNNRVRKVDGGGVITTVVGTGVAGFSGDGGPATNAKIHQPVALMFDIAENLYVVDQLNQCVRKVTPAGIISSIIGNGIAGYAGDGGPASSASLNIPGGINIDTSGNIYLCDCYNNVIRKISPSGIISTFAGTGVAGFSGDGGPAILARLNQPTDIVFDNAGNMYVSDFFNSRVRTIVFSNSSPRFDSGIAVHLSVCENSSATLISPKLSVSDSNSGQTETWSLLTAPVHGIIAGLSTTISSTGSFVVPMSVTYTPSVGYSGSDSCYIIVSDGAATDTMVLYVSILPLPYAGTVSGPSSLCVGSTGVFSSTASGGVWASSIPSVASINSASGLSAGASAGSSVISYTVSNGCGSATDTQIISVISVPLAGTVAGPSFLCSGSTGLFTSGVPGGVWSSSVPAVATVNSISGMAGGLVTGSSIISYTVSNACGSATDTQMVTVSTIPYAGTISGPSTVCAGAVISLTGVVSGGAWSSSGVGVATVSGGFVGGVASGTTIISYTLTNSCGMATDTQLVTVLPLPALGGITGPFRVCLGQQITLTEGAMGGSWNSVNSSVATVGATSGIVGGASVGVTLISYAISNSCGTTADTQSVTVLPLPDAGVAVSSVPVACVGGTISVSDAVPGGMWSSSVPAVATVDVAGVVVPLSAGTVVITYTITDDNGCTNYATTTLTIPAISPLVINPEITLIKCNGDNNGAINIAVSGGSGSYQFLWSGGSTSSSLSALSAGSYSVEVTDVGSGCKDTAIYVFSTPGIMNAEITTQPDRCNAGEGSITVVNVDGGTPPFTFVWSTGATTTSVAALHTGSYAVTITDAHLCTAHLNVTVAEDSCNVVTVHNVITPNGDGYNDFWVIDGIDSYPDNEVKVFDKWGDEIFESAGYKNKWDGGRVSDGTYFYLVKVSGKVMKGTLLIKR